MQPRRQSLTLRSHRGAGAGAGAGTGFSSRFYILLNLIFAMTLINCKMAVARASVPRFSFTSSVVDRIVKHSHRQRDRDRLLSTFIFTSRQNRYTSSSSAAFVPIFHVAKTHQNYRTCVSLDRIRQIHSQSQSRSHSQLFSKVKKGGFEAAQQAVTSLAQKNRTWKRLAPIVELATLTQDRDEDQNRNRHLHKQKQNTTRTIRTIADIGCDHGLLSIALAASGKFDLVIGADVSENALENGAMEFHKKVNWMLRKNYTTGAGAGAGAGASISSLPVEFRFGDGLEPLNRGEADAICLAGMGVDTMISILSASVSARHEHDQAKEAENEDESTSSSASANASTMTQLDHLECQSLYLQPPTSRPRQLMELYKNIQGTTNEWILSDERISMIKKRWYITMAFDRRNDSNTYSNSDPDSNGILLPGHFLSRSADETQRLEYYAYVKHHLQWLNKDLNRNATLCENDIIWREANLQNDD